MTFARTIIATMCAVLLITVVIIGCSNPAVPKSCIEAAQNAGLPEEIIEKLRNPADLNQIEKFALRQALNQAGVGEACSHIE